MLRFIENGFLSQAAPPCSPPWGVPVCRPLHPWAAWVDGEPVLWNGQACCTGRQFNTSCVAWLPCLPLPWVQDTSDPAACHVARPTYTYMSLSNRLIAFAPACSSAFPLPLSTFFRSPRVEHFLPLAPVFLKHVECTSVIQLTLYYNCVFICNYPLRL